MRDQLAVNQQHVAVDPLATWQRMEELVNKALTTPKTESEKHDKTERAEQIRRRVRNSKRTAIR